MKRELDISLHVNDYELLCSDHGCDVNPLAQKGNSCIELNDPDTAPSPKTTANDVYYFFNRSEDKVVCNIFSKFPTFSALQFSKLITDNIILREAKEADLSKWSSSICYEYFQKTLTISLHPHIEK